MVTIDVSDLEADSKDSVVTFIEAKLPVKSEKDGDLVTFEDKSPRSHVSGPEIRTYLKRFLHANNLRKRYRLLSDGSSLRFVKQNVEDEEEEDKEEEEKSEKK